MKSGQSHLLKGVTISKIYINSPALNAVCIIWVKILPYKSGVEVRKQSELSPDKTDLIQSCSSMYTELTSGGRAHKRIYEVQLTMLITC